MHFHELPEVARAMNAAVSAAPALVRETSRPGADPPTSSPSTRRNSDPAPPSSLVELEQEQKQFAFRRSEASASSVGTTSSGGFVFASANDPVLDTLQEEIDDPGPPSDVGSDVGSSPKPRHDNSLSDIRPSQGRASQSSRFRPLTMMRGKQAQEKSATLTETDVSGLPPTYSLMELRSNAATLVGVDALHKEDSLADADFEKLFKCTKSHFRTLPLWRQNMLKKEYGLH